MRAEPLACWVAGHARRILTTPFPLRAGPQTIDLSQMTCLCKTPRRLPAHCSVGSLLSRQTRPPLPRRAHSPEDGRLLQSLCYHKDAVTCLAASAGERPG